MVWVCVCAGDVCVSIELNMASSPLPSPLDRCFSAFCINQNQQQIELTKLAKGVAECQARGGGGVGRGFVVEFS